MHSYHQPSRPINYEFRSERNCLIFVAGRNSSNIFLIPGWTLSSKIFTIPTCWDFIHTWVYICYIFGLCLVMSKWSVDERFSLLKDEQMSNKGGVEHQADMHAYINPSTIPILTSQLRNYRHTERIFVKDWLCLAKAGRFSQCFAEVCTDLKRGKTTETVMVQIFRGHT